MAGSNEDRSNLGIVQQRVVIGAGLLETEFAGSDGSRDPACTGDSLTLGRGLGQRRQQYPGGKLASANDAYDRRCRWRLAGGELFGHYNGASEVRCGLRVSEEDAKGGRVTGELAVGFLSPSLRYSVGNERRDMQLTVGYQLEHSFKITLLGPAHEAKRIVMPLRLVGWIIAAGTIGAGDLESQLFLIEVGALQVETHDADEHDASPLATHPGCLVHQLITFCRGGNQHTIDAEPVRKSQSSGDRVLAGTQVYHLRAKLARQGHPLLVEVYAQNLTAIGHQHLHSQQAQ